MSHHTHIEVQLHLKRTLYEHCQEYVQSLLAEALRGIKTSREAANQEEKSSAGDKFETQRAMMHLQMESFIKRHGVAEELETELLSLIIKPQIHVELGALIEVEGRHYFIGVSAPSVTIGGVVYTCLSTEAPLYIAMRGLSAGDWLEWRGDEIEIQAIS